MNIWRRIRLVNATTLHIIADGISTLPSAIISPSLLSKYDGNISILVR
jgi:hypothetical protein